MAAPVREIAIDQRGETIDVGTEFFCESQTKLQVERRTFPYACVCAAYADA